MPARQRGFARKRDQRWLAGWYEDGKQRMDIAGYAYCADLITPNDERAA